MGDAKQPGWMSSCFLGRPRLDLLFPFPEMPAGERETLQMVLEGVRKFAPSVDAARIDREARIPPEVVQGLKEMGLFGMIIPEAYGGLGLSYTAYMKVMEEYGRLTGCMSSAALIGAHTSIGLKPILGWGSEALKRKYLPSLATGETLAAFALTEPNAGSDAGALQTRAERGADGSWTLNGSKIFITNGGLASVFTVFARTGEKISCFAVEKSFPGFSVGQEERKMGIKGSSTTALFLENVKVPAENLVGEEGEGFRIAVNTLNSGRLGLGGAGVGLARHVAERCVAYAKERKQFQTPIAEFDLIREKFAEMQRDVFVLESMAFVTARYADRPDVDYRLESAICKVFGTEALFRAANHAVQIHGGNGFIAEYPFERVLRDSRIASIFEGTNEVLRCFIALTGVKPVGEALKAGGAAGYVLGRAKRALLAPPSPRVPSCLEAEAAMIADGASILRECCDDALRRHRKEIVKAEMTLKRLSDMAVDLFGISATVSRTASRIAAKGGKAAERELALTRQFCREAWARILSNEAGLDRNDDADLLSLASTAYADGGYALTLLD